MSDTVDCRYHGRGFSAGEMALMRALIAGPPARNRSQLATEFCRQTGWVKPDGGLKTMMAKVTMLKMHRDGVITLPPARPARKKTRVITFGPETEPPSSPAPVTLDAVRPIHLVRITGAGRKTSRLRNEFIARYHDLGYKTLVGAQMRYAVHDRDGRPLAMLGFSTAAWKTAPRDTFIGWSPQTREKNLPLMIDNSRFLILPWIRIPNLASHILSVIRKQLPNRLGATIQDYASAHRDLRRDTALYRNNIPCFRMGPRRNHEGTWTLRYEKGIRATQEGHLALPAQERLEENPQPLIQNSAITPIPNGYK